MDTLHWIIVIIIIILFIERPNVVFWIFTKISINLAKQNIFNYISVLLGNKSQTVLSLYKWENVCKYSDPTSY